MKKIVLSQIIFIIAPLIFCFQCCAQTISSSELIKDAKQYDGKNVTYQGEVVGDIMMRGEFAWLNINDGSNAIGIWINKKLIKDIFYTGSYQAKGDLVEITGKFNRSCIEHGGDLDIHAQSINKIASGSKIYHAVNTKAINFTLSLSGIILLVLFLRLHHSRKAISARFF
ncbi:MAG: DNA-binding protein [Candidatus Omnitrophota bacterium]